MPQRLLFACSDKSSNHPDDVITFKISQPLTENDEALLARIISAVSNLDGPGIIEEAAAAKVAEHRASTDSPSTQAPTPCPMLPFFH